MIINTLLIASSNPGKIKEFSALLAPIRCIEQAQHHIPPVAETGLSFIENAILKARHACTHSGHAALADDSGLCVEALNGKPGIFSARFSGPDATDDENMACLLDQMKQIETNDRHAYFYCALALVKTPNDPTPIVSIGRLDGMIATAKSGSHGFGYDPLFYMPNYAKTLAELSPEIKNTISHRAQALKAMRHQLL